MLSNKIGIRGGIVILIFILTGILFCLYQYYSELENNKDEWYRSNYFEKGFKGTISEIGEYEYNSDFKERYISLTISVTDPSKEEVHYGMLDFIKQPLLKTFITKGDSVIKIPKDTYITFKNRSGQSKTFELPLDIEH